MCSFAKMNQVNVHTYGMRQKTLYILVCCDGVKQTGLAVLIPAPAHKRSKTMLAMLKAV